MIIGKTKKNDQLLHIVIRVPKEQSAFVYFTLEANENLCFYSTLPHVTGDSFRDIDIKTDISLKDELKITLDPLINSCKITILKDEVI